MNKILKFLRVLLTQQALAYRLALALGVLLLLATTTFAALKTSNYFSTNSDALIATQQFSKGVEGNTVALPASHSNILMMPLLYVQGHLPYNMKSFTLVNVALVLTTVLAWAFLLVRLFGRRYEILILVLLSSLLFASTAFNIGIGNTTFRNIGFPIALWFVFIISDLLKTRTFSRRELIAPIAGGVLFSIVLAGDSFFNYSIVVPLLLAIFWYWLQRRAFTKNMLGAIGAIAGVIAEAWLIKWALAALGIVYFDHVFLGKPAVLLFSHLGASLQIAFRQIIELQGASIFGLTIGIRNSLVFLNLVVLVVGVLGLILILRRVNIRLKEKGDVDWGNNFILFSLALSYFVIVAEYIFSGYVVVDFNGQIIDLLNTRYITLLPLLTIVGFIWFLKQFYKQPRYTVMLCSSIVVAIALYYPAINASYALEDQNKPVPSKASVDGLTGYLTENHVNTIVTDFWYGPPIQFWTGNRIKYAPQINCNQPVPFDSREDWFISKEGQRTALLVDRGGLNYGYWSCTDEDLVKIYGEPVSRAVAPGVKSGETVNVWIYDYDIRGKLKPFPK